MSKENPGLGNGEKNEKNNILDKEKKENSLRVSTKTKVVLASAENSEWISHKRHFKDNPKVGVKNGLELEYGRGVFAKEDISSGELIAEFVGKKYEAEKESLLPEIMIDHALQIGETEYVHAEGRLAELLNHACGEGANCGIRNKTEVVSLRDIKAGEELRWDYRRTEDSDWVLNECTCGSDDCTGVVGPFADLPDNMKDKYLRDGFTSSWIQEKYSGVNKRVPFGVESLEGNYVLELMDTRNLSEERISEISEFFRYTFNNSFPEYAVCTDCDVSISAPEAFGTGKNYVSLEEIDNECNLPECECGETMKSFIDPQVTLDNLTGKFAKEGKIALVSSEDTGELVGMTFAYYDTLAGAIDKEWGHPYNYMKEEYQSDDLKFDVAGTIDKIVASGKEVDDNTEVLCFNCIVLDKSVRGNLRELTASFLEELQSGTRETVPMISQTLRHEVVRLWMMRGGFEEIDEIFSKNYSFMFGDLKKVCDTYLTKS